MLLKPLPLSVILLLFNMVAGQTKISEEQFITIGSIEQWITINGNDTTNPIILFVHGGPGSTMSHYKDEPFTNWEKEFTLVHWDQRGAGKTFGKNAPEEVNETFYQNNPLSIAEMTDDGIAVSTYLLERFNKNKIILIGTSWGSILGTLMAQKNPNLFHAYIGHAQFVHFSENIKNAYSEVHQIAQTKKDESIILKLKDLGPPPYSKAKTYGQLLRITKQYEKENAAPAPTSWFKIDPAYENNQDSKDRYNGDDYSFLNLVGDVDLGIKSMVQNINFNKTAQSFHLPVILIQGEGDILCSKKLNQSYFEKIRAPKKEYVLVSNAAHGLNEAIVKKQYEILKSLYIQK
ncbi:alpha/beta hydrolase [Maribacter dokdonensis]|uniref:alpha/beta hydrolase n=1 Tax=Maribacter dokdonensis TaxID=320912 RepID=UPI003299AC4D